MKKEFALGILMALVLNFVSADGCGMGDMMYGNFGYGGMFFGWLIGLLVIVALVLLIAWLIKQLQKG